MPVSQGGLVDVAKSAAKQAADQAGSWFGDFKTKATQWVYDLDLTVVKVVEIASYLGIGFFVGFLLKKYLKAVFLFLVFFAGAVWVLEECDLIIINWGRIQELASFAPTDTVGSLLNVYLEWVKAHFVVVFSSFVGFLIGYKFG